MSLSIIDLIIIFFISGLSNFIIAYVKEKGRNIATQEDIGKITSTVESIKTDLQIALKNKLDLIDDQRQTLLDYYIGYHHFVEDSLNIRTEYMDDPLKCREMRSKISEGEIQLRLFEAKIELFAYDEKLIQIIYNLNLINKEYSSFVCMQLIEIEEIQREINTLNKNLDYNSVKDKIEDLYKKRNEKYNGYCNTKIEYYRKRSDGYHKLKEIIKAKLLYINPES